MGCECRHTYINICIRKKQRITQSLAIKENSNQQRKLTQKFQIMPHNATKGKCKHYSLHATEAHANLHLDNLQDIMRKLCSLWHLGVCGHDDEDSLNPSKPHVELLR